MEMRWRYILAYLILVGAYALFTLTAPVSGETFNLDRFTLGLLQLTIILPIVGIWLAGVKGAANLRQYVGHLKKGPERQSLQVVANGLVILATGLIVTSIIGSLRSYAIANGWVAPLQITQNYLNLAFSAMGLLLILRGSRQLLSVIRRSRISRNRRWVIRTVYIAVLAALVTLVLNDPYVASTPDPARYQSFYLPEWLVIATLCVPYVVAWYFGTLAVFNIRCYADSAKDEQSGAAFRRIALGLATIIMISIVGQVLGLVGGWAASLPLGLLLALLYVLIFLYGLGYILIASGSRRLYRLVAE